MMRDHFFGSVDPSGAVVPAGGSSGRGVPVTAASAAVEDVEGVGVMGRESAVGREMFDGPAGADREQRVGRYQLAGTAERQADVFTAG